MIGPQAATRAWRAWRVRCRRSSRVMAQDPSRCRPRRPSSAGDRAAPPRPAAVRGARRRRRVGRARRPDPGRLREGSLVANSSQGGGSKDTWVLAGATEGAGTTPGGGRRLSAAPGRLASGPATPPTLPSGPWPGNADQSARARSGSRLLSRIAESLYWIGRSTERAEDTARLLDVHYHHLLEDRFTDETVICAALLRAMGTDVADVRDADTVDASAGVHAVEPRFPSSPRSRWRGRTHAVRERRSRRRCGRS